MLTKPLLTKPSFLPSHKAHPMSSTLSLSHPPPPPLFFFLPPFHPRKMPTPTPTSPTSSSPTIPESDTHLSVPECILSIHRYTACKHLERSRLEKRADCWRCAVFAPWHCDPWNEVRGIRGLCPKCREQVASGEGKTGVEVKDRR